MEHNIGASALAGLAFTSSVYVWRSNSFNNLQKIVLLICVIVFPIQWIGIIVVLIYNNYVENNSVENVAERKVQQIKTNLNSSISDLKDLKDKGILTQEEYKVKVSKIENEKYEQDLKNSVEYKQLKTLLDSEILTKEEFESKIKLIVIKKEDRQELYYDRKPSEEKVFIGDFIIGNRKFNFLHNNVVKIEEKNGEVSTGIWCLNDKIDVIINVNSLEMYFKNINFANNGFYFTYRGNKLFAENINKKE